MNEGDTESGQYNNESFIRDTNNALTIYKKYYDEIASHIEELVRKCQLEGLAGYTCDNSFVNEWISNFKDNDDWEGYELVETDNIRYMLIRRNKMQIVNEIPKPTRFTLSIPVALLMEVDKYIQSEKVMEHNYLCHQLALYKRYEQQCLEYIQERPSHDTPQWQSILLSHRLVVSAIEETIKLIKL